MTSGSLIYKIRGEWYTVVPQGAMKVATAFDIRNRAGMKLGTVTREKKDGGTWYVNGTFNSQDLRPVVEDFIEKAGAK